MRQLDSCDFCGDAPDGVYEVVPASVAGESRRLALCSDCRETLRSVVDPLLDAAEAESKGTEVQTARDRSEQDADSNQERDADSSPARDDNGGSGHEPSTSAERAVNSRPERGRGATSVDDEADGGDESTAVSGADEGVTIDGGASEAAAGDAETTDADSVPERKPAGYGQVIRLLQNREDAMPRDDLRALATNAYDLDERAFADAVDAAVENGDIEETNGDLTTT